MFLFIGLAVQTKYAAVAALPFLIHRRNLKYAWVAVAAMIAPYAPFIGSGWRRLFSSLIDFMGQYAFNGSIHGLARALAGEIGPATSVCKILLFAILLYGVWRFHPSRSGPWRDDPVPGSFFSLGAILLLAPTVHFWYISWIVPFLALRFKLSWLVLCLTASGYFAVNGVFHHTGVWRLPAWIQLVEWLPFYTLFLIDIHLFRKRSGARPRVETPRAVTVITSARNEAERIGACVRSILQDNAVREVIVVDGESGDSTAQRAANAGAAVIAGSADLGKGGGRGGQINAGLAAAKGDIIAVVHADVLAAPGVFTRIRDILARDASIVGGAIGCVFTSPGPLVRLVELANDFRAVFLGISFGDQTQFFRREMVVRNGGFPDIPLMEDVEISLKLSGMGRQVFLFGDFRVSARRWNKKGHKNFTSVLCLTSAYLWRRLRGPVDTRAMYREYYGD
ncbi:MAG: glycosyltransferase [Desulfobacterales bacterium]|nr:glycosyltransferase [Desulfobacterales bacterium]